MSTTHGNTPADPDRPVIASREDALKAMVDRFVDGDADDSQSIADQLGDWKRKQRKQRH